MSALLLRIGPAWAMFALLCGLQLFTLLRAPQAWLPEEITLRLRPGQALELGAATLGAPRAAERQLALARDAEGRWWLRNLAPAQPLVLLDGEVRRRSGELPLSAGQRLHLGAALLHVAASSPGRVQLGDGRHTWRYDGATLLRDGAPQPACPETPLAARLGAWWNRLAPHALTLARPLVLGGNLHCGNRIAIPALESGNALVTRAADGVLSLAVRGVQPVLAARASGWEDLALRALPLAGADAFALGRTRFDLRAEGDTLRLAPRGQVSLYAAPTNHLPPELAWRWRQRAHWSLPPAPTLAWAGALAVLLAGLLAARADRQRRWRVAAAGLLAAAALLVLLTQRTVGAPGAGISLLLAWGALALLLAWARRPRLLATSAVALLGAGLLVQLDMGLGAQDSAWLRHFQNSAALLALGLPASLLALSGVARGALARQLAERVLLALAGLALFLLLLQVWFGGETGVFEIQPVEFAKLALAALSAHCLALAAARLDAPPGTVARDWRFWLRMAAPALLFTGLLAAALVRVDDYSPLVLLLVWAGTMSLAWCWATGRRAAAGLLAGAACVLLAGSAALQGSGNALGGMEFYAERFQVWQDPGRHPHTGQQVLLGARALGQGGWLGADGLLGLAALGRSAGEALAIPAVQDDFAPSWLLHRHGLAGGLALWSVQALFLAALLGAAAQAWRAALAAGDYRRAWLGRFQCFALCGGAAFVMGHLLLSWGTNLAMFPVMGQPMSFLSSGGSHLLFFICPLLGFAMATLHQHEEM
ncbi:hypothetical protein B0920_07930 [Massilia sp. KIM]|uniref:FtsW/RodA/SpoVE family cell cycle protein n=1 Tax=Massilia sp. KIM TaxID=1955422 RepID=UPI00098F7E52|nr:FtsW/RodA/SpoVE family cell cycle protein [Massilia sp. KIM]OON63311.1 hypothetical protein B0920_07930 [Massilia sp. KIM]